MPLINILVKRTPKQTLSIRIDPELKSLLDEYCRFIRSGRHHVVAQALVLAFERDCEFQAWLSGINPPDVSAPASNVSRNNVEPLMGNESYGS
jgi:hypothetical protein